MSKRAELRTKRAQARKQRNLIIGLIAIGVPLLVAAILIYPNIKPPGDFEKPDSAEYPMADGNAMGDPNAPVLIEEFSDANCSYCRQFHEDTLPQVISDYVATGKVRFVYYQFPFISPESTAAAVAATCAAEQNMFWPYQAIVFANQDGPGSYTANRLEAFAESLKLDMEAFKECVRDGDAEEVVREGFLRGNAAGVDSTPSFLINGVLTVGASAFSGFSASIEAALQSAGN